MMIKDLVWRTFLRWSRLDVDAESLSAAERWSVVAATVAAFIRSRYLRPARLALLARSPGWFVTRRLETSVHSWYRVPSSAAAEHVRLRFQIWPVDVGDHVRIQGGQLTAIGYASRTFCEIIYVLPNGELEPDPPRLEMARAWAAYRDSR